MVTVYVLLAALLTLVDRHKGGVRPHRLHSFGAEVLCRISVARPLATVIVALILTVVLAAAITQLEWDDDFRNMRSGDNRAIQLRQEIMDAFDLRFTPMVLRFDGDDELQALASCRRILPELEDLVDGENLAGIDTIAGVIPPLEVQQDVIGRLRAAAPALEDLDLRFAEALRANGLNPAAFAEGIDHLRTALGRRQPLSLTDLEGTPLARVVDRYVAAADGEVSAAMYLYPPADKWRRGASAAVQEVIAAHPGGVLAGPNVISAELRSIVWGARPPAASGGDGLDVGRHGAPRSSAQLLQHLRADHDRRYRSRLRDPFPPPLV